MMIMRISISICILLSTLDLGHGAFSFPQARGLFGGGQGGPDYEHDWMEGAHHVWSNVPCLPATRQSCSSPYPP